MSKELVISAASHERRVAILEEGQLVEIYIEREKEFALVGSIYKGRVTRVLPGMQSAFVDIGLDGDAFLYVSDVFENLEDYDHDHGHAPQAASPIPPAAALAEALPGESLANAHSSDEPAPLSADDEAQQAIPHEEPLHADFTHEHQHDEPLSDEGHGGGQSEGNRAPQAEPEERQPESNASAPQNFGQFNPTQKYSRPDRGNERNDRGGGQNFRGDSAGDRGRGRFGRRGGRRRGGRPQGGRNLPPSKYASPQGDQRPHESRGNYESRGPQQGRGFEPRGEHRRPEGSRFSPPAAPPAGSAEDEIVLPGESLAKYRNKPAAAASAPAVVEPEIHEPQPDHDDSVPSRGHVQSGGPGTSSGSNVPRRSSGGLPRWLLAESGNEAETSSTGTEELISSADDTATTARQAVAPDSVEAEPTRADASLSEEDVAIISSSLIEAKHEETQAKVTADALVGGAVFDDEEQEEPEEEEETEATDEVAEETEEHEEIHASEGETESHDVGAEEIAALETRAHDSHALREAEADAAHESALHAAAIGDDEAHEAVQPERIEATGTESAPAPAVAEDDSILLPGETRAPRSGAPEPRPDFPRDSARIGGNPRARFQRPFRSGSGGRDRDNRGRDNRGGSSGRPDRRGGRPGGGPRFERRPGGGQHRHHGGHSGPPHRPQLISEMLKAGQDIVIQIAKEPLGKKGARITSHVALPGRFLVYMPTIDHIGVSRKIPAADNRSRLRRLVGEARGAYPGGFIVRTAAGGASDEEIRTDIEFLGKTWNEIKERSEQRKSPALLHRDLNLVERILRDYLSDDYVAVWLDNEEAFTKVVEFVGRFQPKMVPRVKLYTKEAPIFEEFGIQQELDKALRPKVWLKSGGYIVINHTEALVAIDVNTGKFVGKGSTRLEDTIVKTNLEAVKEIVRQIRLRDLGGIIVVDFIDMEERRNREKVLSALQQALEEDKAPSKALSFNEFGLVCITRKRTKQALERVLCQPCPYCTGSGMVKSIPTLCYEIQSEARKMATADHEGPNLTLRVHPEIAKALKTRESMLIDELEQTSHKHIIIQSDATLHWEQYDIY